MQTTFTCSGGVDDERDLAGHSLFDHYRPTSLSQTCSFFRSIIEMEKPTTPELKQLYLFAAERWARQAKLLLRRLL